MTTIYLPFNASNAIGVDAPWSYNNGTEVFDDYLTPVILNDENNNPTPYTIVRVSGLDGTASSSAVADVGASEVGWEDSVLFIKSWQGAALGLPAPVIIRFSGLSPNQSLSVQIAAHWSGSNVQNISVSNGSGPVSTATYTNDGDTTPSEPVALLGTANANGDVDITVSCDATRARLSAIKFVVGSDPATLAPDQTEIAYGQTGTFTTSLSSVTGVTLTDSYGNTLTAESFTDSSYTLPALAHGIEGITLESNVTLSVTDDTNTATSSINFVAPTGYELTSLTSIVDRDLIESDWIYPLAEAATIGDQSLKLASDSFVTHNADGSSGISDSGSYTYYTIDATDGVVTSVTRSVESQVNQPPTANAGTNQSVAAGATVQLDGTGSSIGGTYKWVQISGPTVKLVNADSAKARIITPQVKTDEQVVMGLTVTVGGIASAQSTVTINIASWKGGFVSSTANVARG